MRPTTADAVAATVRVMEHIQRRYASGRGADEFVVDMLADLRHFCESHDLSFHKLEGLAHDHYLAERAVRDRTTGAPAHNTPASASGDVRGSEAAGDIDSIAWP